MRGPNTFIETLPVRDRSRQIREMALEHVFQMPFEQLLEIAEAKGACSEQDLLDMGRRIHRDLVRLARGEISAIEIPRRLPCPGEHAPTTSAS